MNIPQIIAEFSLMHLQQRTWSENEPYLFVIAKIRAKTRIGKDRGKAG
ncbi:MAG: hypothetical protein KAF91_25240 [Nostoc sp. TH1S01]|nr:hypothetical protein [Nostoc sp. TH1S01]